MNKKEKGFLRCGIIGQLIVMFYEGISERSFSRKVLRPIPCRASLTLSPAVEQVVRYDGIDDGKDQLMEPAVKNRCSSN